MSLLPHPDLAVDAVAGEEQERSRISREVYDTYLGLGLV